MPDRSTTPVSTGPADAGPWPRRWPRSLGVRPALRARLPAELQAASRRTSRRTAALQHAAARPRLPAPGAAGAVVAQELAGLEDFLAAEGCWEALVVWRDLLLDGHQRLEAALGKGLSALVPLVDG